MTSDFWVGWYVKLHLMISDVGRWVGQKGSDVRSAIFNFFLFICRLNGHSQNLFHIIHWNSIFVLFGKKVFIDCFSPFLGA
jgi:hypothetical protein